MSFLYPLCSFRWIDFEHWIDLFGMTIKVLRFYNIDGSHFQQVISGALTKSLNQGAHRRYVAPLNYKLCQECPNPADDQLQDSEKGKLSPFRLRLYTTSPKSSPHADH
jgi:hypothetical protein